MPRIQPGIHSGIILFPYLTLDLRGKKIQEVLNYRKNLNFYSVNLSSALKKMDDA